MSSPNTPFDASSAAPSPVNHKAITRVASIHGLSQPSSRASGLYEDHHARSESGTLNLGTLTVSGDKNASPTEPRSRAGSIGSEADLGESFIEFRMRKGRRGSVDEFEIDPAKGDLPSTRSQTEEETSLRSSKLFDHEGEDEEEDEELLRSPTASHANVARSGQANQTEGRLLIIANRLPLSMKVTKKPASDGSGKEVNEMTFTSSSGGLVSALGGCEMDSRWIGWPGAEVKRSSDREAVRKKLDEQNCVPVFLPQKICDPYYNGFCNNLLWPLFHYVAQPVDSITIVDEQFEAYKQANQAFADVVLRTYREGDVVWIHDYHLCLLPQLLRQQHPNIKIGFFFHTPFPAFEIYRALPARKELLAGVLASDLIGFHTPDYQRHFADACVRILNACSKDDLVTHDDHTSKLGAFPIGIDPKRFITSIESEQSRKYFEQYRKEFAGKKVLLGIDRLDYIKGIQHKIYALERLFQKNPKLAQEVVLVQIAVPSRTDVVEYAKLKASTHKLVGRVNGLYGGIGSSPLHYLDQSIPFDRMCALYRAADALVVTSVRDGMNLVAYEFIACQKDMAGCLILSEFAGAAQSLGDGPIQVNPWSITSVSEAIQLALNMPEEERRKRMSDMFQLVTTQTSSAWARQFLTCTLQATKTPLNWLKDLSNDAAHPVEPSWKSPNQTSIAAVAPFDKSPEADKAQTRESASFEKPTVVS